MSIGSKFKDFAKGGVDALTGNIFDVNKGGSGAGGWLGDVVNTGTLGLSDALKSPTPPAPADLSQAGRDQYLANIMAAKQSAIMNNPNVINPYGSQKVTWEGDQPTLTQTLSPEQQALYEKQTTMQKTLGDLGIAGAQGLSGILGTGLDLSGAPEVSGSSEGTRQKVLEAMMGRVSGDLDTKRDQTRSDLIAAGIHPGSKAYDDSMAQIDRQYNDAYQQAMLSSGQEAERDVNLNMNLRKQAIAEILAKRQTPLNELSAFMSGSQVTSPFAGGMGYQGGTNIQAEPVYNAAKDAQNQAMQMYGYDVANKNAMLQGLFGLGGAAIGAF